MPSPFPGMDPYLEKPSLWPNVHLSLIAELRNALNAVLPQPYVANIGERVYINETAKEISPDVFISRSKSLPVDPIFSDGGSATAVCDEPVLMEFVRSEFREPFIQLVRCDDGSRIVAEIEFLSPTNKQRGHGREKYVAKQKAILDSDCHLLEIDLLRTGEPTVACLRKDYISVLPDGKYWICLHRAGSFNYEVWTRTVRQRLPKIRVPLAGKDADVIVDLQAVLDRCYESGKMERNINYNAPLDSPLMQADAEWADSILRSKTA